MRLNVKVWTWTQAVNCAEDWFIDRQDCADINTVLAQKYTIAAVPVMFNEPSDFAYTPAADSVDLSRFDLVLLSDIEYRPQEWIDAWIEKNNIKNWRLLRGGIDLAQPFDHERCVYRPWWIYHRDLKFNQQRALPPGPRPYAFDILLGSRRPNRDFIMLALQKHNLLGRNIVTFRNVFPGQQVNRLSQQVSEYFADTELQWPYVGANLAAEWEVADVITNTVSQTVPWDIYSRTWFSVAAESVSDGPTFFMAEKISKPVFAGRPFVVFGIQGYLRQLRKLGYQTFAPVINESYDNIADPIERWAAAFEEVKRLSAADGEKICQQLQSVVEHNRQRLLQTESLAQQAIDQLLRSSIPAEYIRD